MSMENTINLFGEEEYGKKLLGMLLGILVLSITCIIDDIKTIKPLVKLAGQTIAAIIAVAFGIRIDEIQLSFLTPEWQEAFSIIDFYLNICPYTPIKGVPICATHWFDTGTPETLACANSWYEQLH